MNPNIFSFRGGVRHEYSSGCKVNKQMDMSVSKTPLVDLISREFVAHHDRDTQLYAQFGGAAASPDGTRIYVTNYNSGNVSVIDIASHLVIASVELGRAPVAVVVSPDGSKAYVANSSNNSVSVIDTSKFTARQIPMPSANYTYPSSIAISPDGSHVYVAGNNPIPDFGTAKCYVFVIDTASEKVTAAIRVPYPMALAASPDGTNVYVSTGATSLYTISTATNSVINNLFITNKGPEQPVTGGIAVTADGRYVFLDDGADNKIFQVDVKQNQMVGTIHAGRTSLYFNTDAPAIDRVRLQNGKVDRVLSLAGLKMVGTGLG